MPWSVLQAGDVVNIFYQSTPYAYKFCLAAEGTANAPVIINGVTDASGNRPQFNFSGATTASDCKNIFKVGDQWSLEPYGGIVVGPSHGLTAPNYAYKASFITIQNLDLYGASKGNTFNALTGSPMTYGDAASIWVQLGSDITMQNNLVHGSAFGIFTMAKNNSLASACERIILRSNRIYANGTVNSFFDHNVYMQSTNPIVEGNYIGPLITGAGGSTYKSRSSGEIFRYNYVETSARAVDWVQSESSNPGIATQPDYGTDYAYGNIIVNDSSLSLGASGNPIHYGGDNCGEQANGGISPTLDAPSALAALDAYCGHNGVPLYRKHLYFYNNTVVNRVTSWSYISGFEASMNNTQIDAWNNIILFSGPGNFALLDSVGQLNLRSNNLIFGSYGSVLDSGHNPVAATSSPSYNISTFGTVVSADPLFANLASRDYNLSAGSGAIDKSTGIPSGAQAATGPSSALIGSQLPFAPDPAYMQAPVQFQPQFGANGLSIRSVHGSALDLGALEGP